MGREGGKATLCCHPGTPSPSGPLRSPHATLRCAYGPAYNQTRAGARTDRRRARAATVSRDASRPRDRWSWRGRSYPGCRGGGGIGGGAEESGPGPAAQAGRALQGGGVAERPSWASGAGLCSEAEESAPFRGPCAPGAFATLRRRALREPAASVVRELLPQVCGERRKWRCPRPASKEPRRPPTRTGQEHQARRLAVGSWLLQSAEAEGCSFIRQ